MTTSRPPRIVPDEVVGGRYRVLNELGHGGMSVVYRAHDRLLDREVALKLLKLSEDEPRNLLFLQQEFRAMARLRHPRLVQVFDYGILDSGSSYFTMELLGGDDLSSVGKLPLECIFHVLLSLADVLGFMHARGYVHRDVKPSNVRILTTKPNSRIEIKLMDCGLTERLGRGNTAVAGTLAYLAPEAWLGSPTDVRGDLYALGVLAYEIAAGQLPFDASTGVRLLKTKTERPRDLREVRADVPAEFARLVRDLLAPEPANRPASAMEVVARLSEFADVEFNPDPNVYLRTPALVGRNRELDELRKAITESCSGKPAPTIIVGPAGAGKTRLLDEALLEVGVRGAVIARATGRGFAGGTYEVLRELAAPLLHLPVAAEVLKRIGGLGAIGSARPKSMTGVDDGDPDPVAARRTLHHALAEFLDGVTRHRMIVLAIDDIHLADAASLDALASVVSAGAFGNLAIVATQRTGESVSPSLAHLLTMSHRLELDRMTREQIGELIVGALGPVTPSPTLVEDLERICSGNVYFVLEILRDLAGRGLIERKRTRVLLPDSLDASGLPQDLSGALARRVGQLAPAPLALARIVAVLGHAVDFEFARRLLGASDEEFLDAIDDLRREELVDVQGLRLDIHHPRLREVLYQGLPIEERRALHRRIAQLLREQGETEELDFAAELGHHFAEAGEEREAIEYLVRAGDTRYQGFAYFDARDAYRRALDLLPAAPYLRRRALECKLNDRLGRICFYHDHRSGPAYLEQARRHHLRHGMLWTIAPISRCFGAAFAVGFGVLATAGVNVVLGRSKPLKATLARLLDAFATTTYLANCYTYSGRPEAALVAADQLLPFIYSRHRLPRVGYLMARVFALCLMNRFDEAAAGCEEALAVLEYDRTTPASEHDRVHATGGALITRLWVDLIRGYARNSRWWRPLEQYVRDHSTALLESWLMEARVFAAYRQGKIAETERAWSEFVRKAAQAEVVFVLNKSKVWVGMTYLDAGRTGEAQDMADEVIRVGRELNNPLVLGLGLQLRGMALHAWEQMNDAESCFDEALKLTAQPEAGCWELHHSIMLSVAALALDRGEPARANELAREVQRRNAELALQHDLHRCRASRILGRAALLERQFDAAVEHLQDALTLASELDDSLERARSIHYLGLAWNARGDEIAAERCRAECLTVLTELGNEYQLRRFGYAPEVPESGGGVTVLSRVIKLVSDSEADAQHPPHNAFGAGASTPDEVNGASLVDRAPRAVRDDTLVAADTTTDSFPSTPA